MSFPNISVVEPAAVVGLCEHLKGNRYVNNIFAIASGMRKLSHVSCIPKGRRVFRGVGGVKLTDEFVTEKKGGGRGGVDFGECLLVLECCCFWMYRRGTQQGGVLLILDVCLFLSVAACTNTIKLVQHLCRRRREGRWL